MEGRIVNMICIVYEALESRWSHLVRGGYPAETEAECEEQIIAAHNVLVAHRLTCEVCRNEDLPYQMFT